MDHRMIRSVLDDILVYIRVDARSHANALAIEIDNPRFENALPSDEIGPDGLTITGPSLPLAPV
jgi:hypothetical protein